MLTLFKLTWNNNEQYIYYSIYLKKTDKEQGLLLCYNMS